MKRLSNLEVAELMTVHGGKGNRFLTPRWTHLEKRGLVVFVDAEPRLTDAARAALRSAGYPL